MARIFSSGEGGRKLDYSLRRLTERSPLACEDGGLVWTGVRASGENEVRTSLAARARVLPQLNRQLRRLGLNCRDFVSYAGYLGPCLDKPSQ